VYWFLLRQFKATDNHVSMKEQNQGANKLHEKLREAGCEKIMAEKKSGKTTNGRDAL
jgi:predicted urease superfamily metal-dependent hydrolase